jgi:hypothetical protein
MISKSWVHTRVIKMPSIEHEINEVGNSNQLRIGAYQRPMGSFRETREGIEATDSAYLGSSRRR